MSKQPSERKPRSGGPRTPEGKQISALNATRHGCTSKTLLLKNERDEEWLEVKKRWMDDYQPDTETFAADVERAAQAEWLLHRNLERYNELEQKLFESCGSALDWSEEQHRLMERFLRYKATAERNFYRARQAAEQRRRNRFQETMALERRDELRQTEGQQVEDEGQEKNKPGQPAGTTLRPLKWPPLVQNFRIRLVDGRMVSTRQPKREELERVALQYEPPRDIRRWLYFENGVSTEYAWIPEKNHEGRQDVHFAYDLSFAEWLELEKREADLGTGHATAKVRDEVQRPGVMDGQEGSTTEFEDTEADGSEDRPSECQSGVEDDAQ